MKLGFIVKGTIRNKRRFYEDLTLVENLNLFEEVEVIESAYHKHSVEIARSLTEKGFDYLIAVGGDGTMNEVLNGYLQVRDENPDKYEDVVLGVLPYGTANDFSRTVNLNGGVQQLVEMLEKNTSKKIDVGDIEFTDEDGNINRRYFLNISDVGIGAYVVKKVNSSKKRLGSNFTFLKAITETFITYEQSTVTVKTPDGLDWRGKVLTLCMANGKYFGSGLGISPESKVDDGRFGLVIMGDVSIKDYVLNLRKLKKCQRIDHPRVHYYNATEVEIIPEKYSCAAECDGEFLGYAPLKIKALYHHINFLLPSS